MNEIEIIPEQENIVVNVEGVKDYNLLTNKPSINDVELTGNKTLQELGIQPTGDYALRSEIPTKLTQLQNDGNFVKDANYVHTDNNFTTGEKEKLESLLSEFRIQKVRKNLGDQLSGGERRRTEIARCLAINPKFIMLDEPFAGVDPIAVEDIQYIVYKLKEKNIGILITDHNAPETLSITDRAYLLFEGKILFQGTSEELAENPIVREKYLGRNFVFRRKKFE